MQTRTKKQENKNTQVLDKQKSEVNEIEVASENEPSHTSKDPEPMEEQKTTRKLPISGDVNPSLLCLGSGKRSLAGKAEKGGPTTTEDP